MQGRTMILTNPGWSVHDEAATADPSAPLRPVYPATEGIPPRFLHDRIRSLINEVVPAMVDPLPDTTRQGLESPQPAGRPPPVAPTQR